MPFYTVNPFAFSDNITHGAKATIFQCLPFGSGHDQLCSVATACPLSVTACTELFNNVAQ